MVAIRQTFKEGHLVGLVVDTMRHAVLVSRNVRGTQKFGPAEEDVSRGDIREALHARGEAGRWQLQPLWELVDQWVADRRTPLMGYARGESPGLSYRLGDSAPPPPT
ncbi:hypothetical protein ACWKWC_00530 [Geodermatophilus nigrescens]